MITTTDEIDLIVNECRNEIALYCLSDCKAKCCKKGKLLLSIKEADYVIGNSAKFKKFLRPDSMVELDLTEGCPSLNAENKCIIHDSSPLMCREFPVFKRCKTIILAEFCPAVNEPFFNKWEQDFIKKGLKIVRQ